MHAGIRPGVRCLAATTFDHRLSLSRGECGGPREVVEPGGGATEPEAPECLGPTGAVKSLFFFSSSLFLRQHQAGDWRRTLGVLQQPGSESVPRPERTCCSVLYQRAPPPSAEANAFSPQLARRYLAGLVLSVSLAAPSANPSFLLKGHCFALLISFVALVNEPLWFPPKMPRCVWTQATLTIRPYPQTPRDLHRGP